MRKLRTAFFASALATAGCPLMAQGAAHPNLSGVWVMDTTKTEMGPMMPSSMTYTITHITRYDYSNNVSICHNFAHLAARSCPWQTCVKSDLQISSVPAVPSGASCAALKAAVVDRHYFFGPVSESNWIS